MRTLTSTDRTDSDITILAKVKNGQAIRCSGWSAYKTIASHREGYLRGIDVTFTNGDTLIALPKTPVEVSS